MMPNTVPNRPTNGADDEMVASTGSPRCKLATSRFLPRSIERRDPVNQQLELDRVVPPLHPGSSTPVEELGDAPGRSPGRRARP